jgi:excisionase family DNA binding protein
MLNLLSLEEAAEELKISLHTMRAWAFQRRFATLKLGRRRMVEREELERFARAGVIAAREGANERAS